MSLTKQIEKLIVTGSISGIPLIDEIVNWERKQRGLGSQTEPSRMATSDDLALIRFLSQDNKAA